MGIIKLEDVIAYQVGEEIVCSSCMTQVELGEVERDDVIIENPDDDDLIFCDRCNKQAA